MIKILVIFFTQYFQGNEIIWWLESPLSTKRFKVQSFFQKFSPSMNGMDEKKNLWAISSS